MGFLSAYLLFIAKAISAFVVVVAAAAVIIAMVGRSKRGKSANNDELEVKYLNSELHADKVALEQEIFDKSDKKQIKKHPVKPTKAQPRLFVLHFDGDIEASETDTLSRQITAIIQTADKDKDKVLLCLESPGGVVHGYGLAASQLARLKHAGIVLTVAVDKVAASGGYMMACVADHIIAAPFAVLGSVGVVAQVPNIHRLLKEKHVDVELYTAGKYKRTLTMLGENTDAGREKFKEDLQITHDLFKQHITAYRPQIDIDKVATGETWYGQQAVDNKLVDEIMTSDDFIVDAVQNMDVYQLSIEHKRGLIERLREQFFKQNKATVSEQYFL